MTKTIPIFEVVHVAPTERVRSMNTGGAEERAFKAVDYSVDQLEQRMTDFVAGVQQILAKGAQVVGEFRMERVEVQAEIGVEGKIGFLGTGAAASGGSRIKIVFERAK